MHQAVQTSYAQPIHPLLHTTQKDKIMPTASNAFHTALKNHLQGLADNDELFAVTYAKPNKNIVDCATYIMNEVQKSGQCGLADEEVYAMAVHYYDEDTIDVGKPNNGKVVVNTHIDAPKPVELTAEEKEDARKQAIERQIEAQQALIMKKPVKKAAPAADSQPSLF